MNATGKMQLTFFFAVTQNSVYRAVISDPIDAPYLVKIAKRGVGEYEADQEEKLYGGTMLSVGKELIIYVAEVTDTVTSKPKIQREIGFIQEGAIIVKTTEIVALFLNKQDALDCSNFEVLASCDPRWKEKTVEVLRAIGLEHPKCSISVIPRWRLMSGKDFR